MALLRHSLRQLAPVLRLPASVLAPFLLLDLAVTRHMVFTRCALPVLAVLVLSAPGLLYSPRFGADLSLPVRRATLYHAKMAAVCLSFAALLLVPFVAVASVQVGAQKDDLGWTAVTLLSYLLAGVSVSAAIWPAAAHPESSAADTGMLLLCACLVPGYAVLAVVISLAKGFGGFWLAPCLLTVSIIAYWSGCRTFCRHEVAPAHGLGAGAWRPTPGSRRSLERSMGTTELPDTRGPERPGFVGSEATESLGRSADRYGKPLKHASAAAEFQRKSRPFYPVPWNWIFPLLLMQRALLLFCVVGLLVLLWLLFDVSAQLSRPTRTPPIWYLAWMNVIGWNFVVGWNRMISLLPVAYPRGRLFSVRTAWILVPALIWSMVLCIRFPSSIVVVVAAGMSAHLSFVFWLSVPPHPRHTKARWVHLVMLVGCFLGSSLLFIGLSFLVHVFPDSTLGRLLQDLWGYVVAGVAEPLVAWSVSGILAVVAILFWSHAHARFKYMEGNPPVAWPFTGP